MKKSMRTHLAAMGLMAIVGLHSAHVFAADHPGDVGVYASSGQLKLGGQRVEIDGLTGYNIYRADFADMSHGPWATYNPGFQTQGSNRLNAGSLIGFEGLKELSFWDGVRWASASTGVGLAVADYEDVLTTWSGAGVVQGETQVLGEVRSSGNLHEHLVFSVTEGAAVGAYKITLRLNSADYLASEPFFVVLNRGLTADEFLLARQALVQATAVPEPASAGMLLAGLMGLFACLGRVRGKAQSTRSGHAAIAQVA